MSRLKKIRYSDSSNPNYVHGMKFTPEYNAWKLMRQRCRNPRNPSYKKYGGAGIEICKRWEDFMAFYRDMGPRPSPMHSIDRINNSRGYKPSNCRWATPFEQQNNKNNTIFVTAFGVTKPMAEWTREMGFSAFLIRDRIRAGWSEERAVMTPQKAGRK